MINDTTSHTSFFDEKMIIDREHCAITLICPQGDETHSDLIIEKIKRNQNKRIYKLAFYNTGSNCGSISSSPITPNIVIQKLDSTDTLAISRCSDTWKVDIIRVKNLIQIAEKERDYPIEYPTAYCMYGNKSILSPYVERIKVLNSPQLKKLSQTHPTFYKELVTMSNACVKKHCDKKTKIFDNMYFVPNTKGGFFIDHDCFDIIGREKHHYVPNLNCSEDSPDYDVVTVEENLGSMTSGLRTQISCINNLEELKKSGSVYNKIRKSTKRTREY